ncbi:MAG: universal stress protein [Chloroflexi bacterium]|nr:universal stress protein [Chloroflexota bacterium]MBV9895072.1 universal stress protein [Chloroflexota bacterium]
MLRAVAPEETCVWQWKPGAILDERQAVVIARQQLEDLVARLQTSRLAAEARVEVGPAVPTIDSVAAEVDADLMVMISHARTGALRAALGSVADAVVRTSSRPVLVCRLVQSPRGKPKSIDVFHALQHTRARMVPQSIASAGYHSVE